ncbi:MAG TPA: cyclic nucleotide-binding domain-containing protein [Gaiellaceae bacterium]
MDAARLQSVPLFASLSDHDRQRVALWTDEIDVPAGKELATEGELAYEFFVILDGTAEVTHDGETVAELGPNDFFGEIGLLESERRTATVTAKTPMRAIVMFGPNFRHVEREMPELAHQIRTAIQERITR